MTASRSRRTPSPWILGAVAILAVLCGGTWFAWNQGALDPDDRELVRTALAESDDDEARVRAVIAVFDEQVALKQTGWRRRHGPGRYALDAYLDALAGIMEREPASEAARLAASWVLGWDRGPTAQRAIRILDEHHLLATPSDLLNSQPHAEAQAMLERQVELRSDARGRALARLALAEWHLFIEQAAREADEILALDPEDREDAAFFSGGLPVVNFAASRDAEREHDAAIALLGQLRDTADEHLPPEAAEDVAVLSTQHLELGLGSIAPEIVGTDLDGNELRLSDFRGKVVVLDFWGHW